MYSQTQYKHSSKINHYHSYRQVAHLSYFDLHSCATRLKNANRFFFEWPLYTGLTVMQNE